jgi:hypothetical protein
MLRRDMMDVKNGLYLHSSLTNDISVYGDVGWEALAVIIVQKWVNGLHEQELFLSKLGK